MGKGVFRMQKEDNGNLKRGELVPSDLVHQDQKKEVQKKGEGERVRKRFLGGLYEGVLKKGKKRGLVKNSQRERTHKSVG